MDCMDSARSRTGETLNVVLAPSRGSFICEKNTSWGFPVAWVTFCPSWPSNLICAEFVHAPKAAFYWFHFQAEKVSWVAWSLEGCMSAPAGSQISILSCTLFSSRNMNLFHSGIVKNVSSILQRGRPILRDPQNLCPLWALVGSQLALWETSLALLSSLCDQL